MARECAVPGCGKLLYEGNQMGVCRAHNHAAGFCTCLQCKGPNIQLERKVQTPEASLPRPVTRQDHGPKGVTMRPYPWSHRK